MNKFVRFLMPIVIAVVLGPLIAGLAAAVPNIPAAVQIADVFNMFVVYIVFSYFIGWPVAFLAGLLVSIWMISRPPSFLVVIGAAVIATALYMGVAALGFLGVTEYTNANSNFFLFTLVLAVIAAAGCWLLTRRIARAA